MSDPIQAEYVDVGKCSKCSCGQVHILLGDADGDHFAAATMSASEARDIAKTINAAADAAEAQQIKSEGRLS